MAPATTARPPSPSRATAPSVIKSPESLPVRIPERNRKALPVTGSAFLFAPMRECRGRLVRLGYASSGSIAIPVQVTAGQRGIQQHRHTCSTLESLREANKANILKQTGITCSRQTGQTGQDTAETVSDKKANATARRWTASTSASQVLTCSKEPLLAQTEGALHSELQPFFPQRYWLTYTVLCLNRLTAVSKKEQTRSCLN